MEAKGQAMKQCYIVGETKSESLPVYQNVTVVAGGCMWIAPIWRWATGAVGRI